MILRTISSITHLNRAWRSVGEWSAKRK